MSIARNSVDEVDGAMPICTNNSLQILPQILFTSQIFLVTDFGPFSFMSSLESNVGVVNLKWVEPLLPGFHAPVNCRSEMLIHTYCMCVYIHLQCDGRDCELEQWRIHW